MEIQAATAQSIYINMESWTDRAISWTIASTDDYTIKLTHMQPRSAYTLTIGHQTKSITATAEGNLLFNVHATKNSGNIRLTWTSDDQRDR